MTCPDVNTVGTHNFRLAPGSPALGKGFTSFQPVMPSQAGQAAILVSANFGATAITPPSRDLGAYPADGSGSLH